MISFSVQKAGKYSDISSYLLGEDSAFGSYTAERDKNMSGPVLSKPRVHLSVGWIGLNIPEKYWSKDKTTNVYKDSVMLVTWQTESRKTFVQNRDSLSLKS